MSKEYVQSQELEWHGCKAVQYNEKVKSILLRNKVIVTNGSDTVSYQENHWLNHEELEEYIRLFLKQIEEQK